MEEIPHVLFCGNNGRCSEFAEMEAVNGGDTVKVLNLSVPSFAGSGQIMLLNLKNLESRTVRFSDINF